MIDFYGQMSYTEYMGISKINELKAPQGRLTVTASIPTQAYKYYGSASNDVDSTEWKGGEMLYNSGDSRLYIQTATSGATATWKRLLDPLS